METEKKSIEDDENTLEMDDEEIKKVIISKKSTTTKKKKESKIEEEEDEDLSTKRVRPKFFCCDGVTKNQNRVALNVMLKGIL